MKKLLSLGLLSMAALVSASAPAFAWWPCFPLCGGCCRSKCCSTVCIRQYNAFTPVCTGSLCCDGCCPIAFGAGGGCCPQMGGGGGGCCVGGGDGCCLGQLPAPGMPGMSAPMMAGAPNYQAPIPSPMGGQPTAYAGPMMGYNPYAAAYNPYAAAAYNQYPMGVQPAGYQPSVYPGAMPMMPQQNSYPAPYYWNAGR